MRLAKIGQPGELEAIAAGFARSAVSFYREPENVAFLAGCVMTMAMFGSVARRMRPGPALLVTFIGGLAARQAYRIGGDIAEIAEAARHAIDAPAA